LAFASRPFGEIQLQVRNKAGHTIEVQSLRSVEAMGSAMVDLHGKSQCRSRIIRQFQRRLPPLQLDLSEAPNGMHLAVGSQLIYNQQSKESVFFGALSADRLLTILHLQTRSASNGAGISGFTVDCAGTTEIMATDEESRCTRGTKGKYCRAQPARQQRRGRLC
jgi:hypothetical protein